MATDQMWLNVINDLEADPVLRERYQYWEFGYPTGNPIAYSALKLREALAKWTALSESSGLRVGCP